MEGKYIFIIVVFSVLLVAIWSVIIAVYVVGKDDDPQVPSTPTPTTPPLPTSTPTSTLIPTQPPAKELTTKVYAVGGYDGGYSALNTVDKYDPAIDSWTSVADMSTVRYNHAVGILTRSSDGKQYLYAVGGTTGFPGGYLKSVERYDPSNDNWEPVADMSTERFGPAVGVLTLNDGKQCMYAFGGFELSNSNFSLVSVEKYDPDDNSWQIVTEMQMITRRHEFAVGVRSVNGTQYLYAVGGYVTYSGITALVEVYNSSNGWTPVASMSTARKNHAVGVLNHPIDGNQYLYAVGGYDGNSYLKSVERYDPSLGTWEPVADMSTARAYHIVTVVTEDDEKQYMYAAGGKSTSYTYLDSVERYDPSVGTLGEWTPVRDMPTKRANLARSLPNLSP